MNDIGFTALDLGLRGAAAGLLLMLVVVLLRVRPLKAAILLAAASAAGGAAYAIATAPYFPKSWLWWALPLTAGNAAIFWLWARATFDDDFVGRRWHGALWLSLVGLGFTISLTWTAWPSFARAAGQLLSLLALLLALAATAQTVRTWSADLVAGRRRLRFGVLLVSLLIITLTAGSDLTSISPADLGIPGSFFSAIGLLTVAALGCWILFGELATSPAMIAMGAEASVAGSGVEPPADRGRDAVAPLLLRRLDHLMTVERVYRQEGLSIGQLAARLDLPEYRLRQAINEGLGYRNFNAFLNRYRIDEAKAALTDPGQREVPVLTIAMDAGFQSIGPFNRAFKADTGMTPTEFRRDALTGSQATSLQRQDNFKIGQSV